jgi:hypothetical protein
MGAIVPHGRRESPSGGADRSSLRAANSAEGRVTVHRRGPRRSVEVSELFYHTFTKICAFRTCLPPSTHRPLAWPKHTLLHAWHTMICQCLDSALESNAHLLLGERSVHPRLVADSALLPFCQDEEPERVDLHAGPRARQFWTFRLRSTRRYARAPPARPACHTRRENGTFVASFCPPSQLHC